MKTAVIGKLWKDSGKDCRYCDNPLIDVGNGLLWCSRCSGAGIMTRKNGKKGRKE